MRVAVSYVDAIGLYGGRMEEGLELAEQAEAAIDDPAWRDEIAARRATLLLGMAGPRAATDLIGEAAPLSTPSPASAGRVRPWPAWKPSPN